MIREISRHCGDVRLEVNSEYEYLLTYRDAVINPTVRRLVDQSSVRH